MTQPRPWRLTDQAEAALTEIARWTVDRFGPDQARRYRDDLIDRCERIARGEAPTRDASLLAPGSPAGALRYAMVGRHCLILLDRPDMLVVLDILHQRADLPAKLARLKGD